MKKPVAFLKVAQQEGFQPHDILPAFAHVEEQLRSVGYEDGHIFYIYRTPQRKLAASQEEAEAGVEGEAPPQERSRILVTFACPDDAFVFAQRNHLRPVPRLLPMTLDELLATFLQHAAIRSLIFSEEHATRSPDTHIPTVLHIDRRELLALLRGKTSE
jgi:hypothetical protein